MTRTAYLLFLSSCSTAIIHALIPDHWLPFVLMSRAERWSDRRAAALTGLAGSLHVLVTLLAGALTILVGSATVQDLARRTGHSLGSLIGLLLVIFGVSYGLFRHLREARVHAAAASRSHTQATVAPGASTRSSSRRISVPSPAAPPPVLSAMSARTTGRSSRPSASATASRTGTARWMNSRRCFHATVSSRSAMLSARAASPLVAT